MTDITQLTDRDLLVRIDTKLELMEPRVQRLEDKVMTLELGIAGKERVSKIEEKVRNLEMASASSKGFFDGAKAMWGLIMALPVGAAGLLFGYLQR